MVRKGNASKCSYKFKHDLEKKMFFWPPSYTNKYIKDQHTPKTMF